MKVTNFEYRFQIRFQIRELAHVHLFGKPGHGAPTEDIRKKKFTEYQLSDGTDLATRDDSAIPDYKPSFMKSTAATNGSSGTENGYSNPYRPPLRSYDEGIASMRQLSKSEPDIGPVSNIFVFFGIRPDSISGSKFEMHSNAQFVSDLFCLIIWKHNSLIKVNSDFPKKTNF